VSFKLKPISPDDYGQLAVVSVVFVRGQPRWKIQLNTHHAPLFCFTDEVFLENAFTIYDPALIRKKILDPSAKHMFAFIAGRLRGPVEEPLRRLTISTRVPGVVDEVYFKYYGTQERLLDFEYFVGDKDGIAWAA